MENREFTRLTPNLFLNVFVHLFRLHCGGIDRAAAVYGDTFRRRKFRIRDRRRWDIELNPAVFDAAATTSSLAPGIVRILARRIFGFGIRDVNHIVLIDENPARPSELCPGGEKLASPSAA